MNMKRIPIEFEKILKQAENLVMSDPSAQQVVAVLTSKGHILCFANHDVMDGNTADEMAFIRTLAESEDTEVQYAVCMWNDSTIDVPSYHLRDLLAGLNPSNREAKFLLNGGEDFIIKSLKDLIPKLKTPSESFHSHTTSWPH